MAAAGDQGSSVGGSRSANPTVKSPKCCSCNGAHARCKSCACVKAGRPCYSCQPMRNTCCSNPSAPLSSLPQLSAVKVLPLQIPPQPPEQQSTDFTQPIPLSPSAVGSNDFPREPCVVKGCCELIAPSMWRIHMNSHTRGVLSGNVPDTWLQQFNMSICQHCHSLVANSQLLLHENQCISGLHANMTISPTPSPTTDPLPSLLEVCELQCPTIRFISTKVKLSFARVLSSCLRAVASENNIESWTKLLMLSKCVLPSTKRRGRHNKPASIESLCDLWSQGHVSHLWNLAKARSISTKKLQQSRVPLVA